MNLTSPSQVKAWCLEHGFHPNKVMGQNFLIDRNSLDAILDAAAAAQQRDQFSILNSQSSILEIGPGLGVLTEGLLSRGYSVTAIEKDTVLADRLAEALGNPPGLTVLKGDALDFIKAGDCDGFRHLVSNLPYQAGTRIMLELARRPEARPETMTVLVQTEVAERLAAGPGGKTRGLAGVWAQLDYTVTCVRKVPPTCFWPQPTIGSMIVTLVRHHLHDDLPAAVRDTFARLTKQAFEHRRKQLGAIFKGVIESTARAEQLSVEDWIDLATNLS